MSNKEPIRVLQVLTTMNRGGAETMVMNYYRNIDRSQVQFDFLLHRPERSAYDDEIEQLGGIIYRMPAISPSNYFHYKRSLNAFFNQHGWKYPIIHSHLNALSFIVLNAAVKHIPVRISHSHTSINPWSFFRLFKKESDTTLVLKNLIYHAIRKKCRRVANSYFACGIKASDWLYGKRLRNQVTILPNAIDTAKFAFNEQIRLKYREILGLDDELTIIHVGRFDEPKNHFFIIKVFKELLNACPDAKLLLVGNGKLQQPIRKLTNDLGISNSIEFLGIREDIPALLMASDVFLFPSLYEGLPVTLVEAQSSGLPVIASDRVTQEINVTGLVTNLSLELTLPQWVDQILLMQNMRDPQAFRVIIKANYDIKGNAQFLQQYYLSSLE